MTEDRFTPNTIKKATPKFDFGVAFWLDERLVLILLHIR